MHHTRDDKQAPKEEDAAAHQEFDQFLGNDAGAFAYGDYDEEDKEADQVYAQIESVMDERRKVSAGYLSHFYAVAHMATEQQECAEVGPWVYRLPTNALAMAVGTWPFQKHSSEAEHLPTCAVEPCLPLSVN